jgi:hypothetical protein
MNDKTTHCCCSARQASELTKSDLPAEFFASRSDLIQTYQEEYNYDSLRWALTTFPEPLSEFQKAWTWFDEGNSGIGKTALENLDIETLPAHHRDNLPGYVLLSGILDQISTDSAYILPEDTTAIETLLTLATDISSEGASTHDSLLAYRIITDEPTFTMPDSKLKSSPVINRPITIGNIVEETLQVFPNPADDYIVIAYQLDIEGELSIFSQDGRIVHSKLIKPVYNQMVIRIENLVAGIHITTMVKS